MSGQWEGQIANNKGISWRFVCFFVWFLELHHIFVWVTARSIFKAFLPGEAWATNCTSEAGQDGIHRSALPLISLPSAANQTHHIAAVCLLPVARAKKVNSSSTSLDKNILVLALFCLSLSLFLVRLSLQKIGLNNTKRSLFPGSHLSLLTVIRTLMQLCFLHFFFPARPASSSQFAHTTPLNYCVFVQSERLQLNWEYWIADN